MDRGTKANSQRSGQPQGSRLCCTIVHTIPGKYNNWEHPTETGLNQLVDQPGSHTLTRVTTQTWDTPVTKYKGHTLHNGQMK